MELYDLKINGRSNPVGVSFDRLVFSWKVRGQTGKRQKNAGIEISDCEQFSDLIYKAEGKDLDSTGQKISLELKPRTRYFWRVYVETDQGENAFSDISFFETGKMDEKWDADWITMDPEDEFHPEFGTAFNLYGKIRAARLYISGLGLFEAFINGQKAGDDHLAPFNTDYKEGVQYCTYDVTDLLGEKNRISVLLGDGWYKGRLGYTGCEKVYGNDFLLTAELHITYEDQTEETILTDESWKYRRSSVVWSDIYDGECRDELAVSIEENPWKKAVRAEGKPLIERYSLPLTEHERFKVQEVIHTPSGETVLDFGQNFAGYVEFTGQMNRGEWMKMQFGEILQDGNFYRDNYRTAKSEFDYRSDGVSRCVKPYFTYYGFRYVKVEMESPVRKEDFSGIALYSDVERTGWFDSSHPGINQLYQNTVWGLKSNFTDLPTDCPQRDERLAWTGDAQVFSAAASYHTDTKAFYEKYLIDLRKDQRKNHGRVAMYLPNLQPGMAVSVWGDAATIIPMTIYRYYGDAELLRVSYPLMKDWVDYIHEEDVERGERDLWDFGFQLGDWLALDGVTETSMIGATDSYFIASAYYYHSTALTAEAAKILGMQEDFEKYGSLAARIKEQILYHYFTPSGKLAVDTQTAYYISLLFGLYRKKKVIVDSLKTRLKKDCYQIKSGFAGAPAMCNALAEAGLMDTAYDFLFHEEYPGWLYEVNMGATTVWERWNSVLPDGKISDTGMNSLNHYAYGSVAEFLYRYAAGIRETSPGFKTAVIEPHLTSRFQSLKCSYDSAAGKYEVSWEISDNGEVKFTVEIPFQASAVLRLPGYEAGEIKLEAGKYEYRYRPDRDYSCRYSAGSRMDQMKEDQDVLTIAKEECEELYELLINGPDEMHLMTFVELKNSPIGVGDKEKLGRAEEKILKLKARRKK